MTRGVVLFAFNTAKYDYYNMAEFTAKRVNHFLNLPVTLITDNKSLSSSTGYNFDKIITVEPDTNNTFDGRIWINKGRYQAYSLSPYDETLLLDVDYVVNSDRLLKTFEVMDDFVCHENISYLMYQYSKKEFVGNENSLPTLWATVVAFKKTKRVKQIFECLEMIQKNYQHYANLHKFESDTFRNDYGLTLAWRIVNGHTYSAYDILPWNLLHIGLKTKVYTNNQNSFNTEYTIVYDRWKNGKIKKEYIAIKDMDFHVINKDVFLEIMT